MRTKTSVLSIILVNLFPIFGFMFFQWNLSDVIFLYWFENITIGIYNILKMLVAEKPNERGILIHSLGKSTNNKSKWATIIFFIVHYGMFTFGHGVFVFGLLIKNLNLSPSVIFGIGLMFVSHGISYLNNFIRTKEYEVRSPESFMAAPYKRIIVMHLTVIFGGLFVVNINGQSLGALIMLTVFKTIADILSHNYEHNKFTFAGSKKTSQRVFHVNSALIKKIFPNYEKYAFDAYKKSIETGKWDEVKSQMDPKVATEVEKYWSQNGETKTNK